jgi:hypothetical protein
VGVRPFLPLFPSPLSSSPARRHPSSGLAGAGPRRVLHERRGHPWRASPITAASGGAGGRRAGPSSGAGRGRRHAASAPTLGHDRRRGPQPPARQATRGTTADVRPRPSARASAPARGARPVARGLRSSAGLATAGAPSRT